MFPLIVSHHVFDMIIHDTLAELGISNRQTDLYLTLLKLGPSSIRDIAAAAGLNRGSTYEELKKLRTMGLVTYSPQGKRKFFCAEPPEILLRQADEKRTATLEAFDRLERDILPDLQQMIPEESSTRVFHYEGDEGVEYFLRDILSTMASQSDKTYRVYSARQIRKYLYRPFPGFTKARVDAGVHVNVIAIGEGGEDAPLADRKWINSSDSHASYLAIYGTKCAMVSLMSADYPAIVILNSEGISSALRISFDTLWQRL